MLAIMKDRVARYSLPALIVFALGSCGDKRTDFEVDIIFNVPDGVTVNDGTQLGLVALVCNTDEEFFQVYNRAKDNPREFLRGDQIFRTFEQKGCGKLVTCKTGSGNSASFSTVMRKSRIVLVADFKRPYSSGLFPPQGEKLMTKKYDGPNYIVVEKPRAGMVVKIKVMENYIIRTKVAN